MNLLRRLRFRQTQQTKILKRIAETSGVAIGLMTRHPDDIANDVIYFGVCKACRSLMAARCLCDQGFPDDCFVILRTAYEAYLLVAAATNSAADEIANRVVKRQINIGIGKTIKRRNGKKWILIDRETNAEYPHRNLGPHEMAEKTGNTLDKKIHAYLYGYLCEHGHPNMITSGEFRISGFEYGIEFSKDPKDFLRPLLLAIYLGHLCIGEIAGYEDLDPPEQYAAMRQLTIGCKDIAECIGSDEKILGSKLGPLMLRRANEMRADLIEHFEDHLKLHGLRGSVL